MRIDEFGDVGVQLEAENVPDPPEAYNEVMRILRFECDIGKGDIQENQYQHEKDGDTERIFSEIRAYDPKGKFSFIYVKVKIFIEMKPAKHEDYDYVGDIEVNGSARVRTHYPQESWFQQTILWHAFRVFFEKVLYNDVRQVFLNECDEYMMYIRDGLKSYFDMLPTIK